MYTVYCIVQCTLFIVFYSVKCFLFCTVFTIYCIVQCTLFIVLYNVHCLLYCTVYTVYCIVHYTLFIVLYSVHCMAVYKCSLASGSSWHLEPEEQRPGQFLILHCSFKDWWLLAFQIRLKLTCWLIRPVIRCKALVIQSLVSLRVSSVHFYRQSLLTKRQYF